MTDVIVMNTRNERLEIATARTTFLQHGTGGDQVRPLVAASWRRSRTMGVDAMTPAPSFHTDLDTDGRLASAARPVLHRLADEVSGLALSIALTDAQSRLLLRIDTEVGIGQLLDSVHFAPGFDYGESAVGTNGVGTAVESRQPVTISGPEHFAERLQAFACVGAPVRDPFTGRVTGVLDITCLVEDSSPILRSLVRAGAADLEKHLLRDRGFEQQAVFDAYTRTAARSKAAIAAVGPTVLLSNTLMQSSFTAEEAEQLRTHARYLTDRAEQAEEQLELGSGVAVHLRAQRVTVRDRAVGVVLEASRIVAESTVRAESRYGSESASPGWRRAELELATAVRSSSPVLITGESASGKATLVTAVFRALRTDAVVEVVDEAERAVALAAEMKERATPTLVLIRRLDRWDPSSAAAIRRLAAATAAPHLFAATADQTDGIDPALIDAFASSTTVPPLRHRTPDLVRLAEQFTSVDGRRRPLAPDAVHALSSHSWPGNLAELEQVMRRAAARRPTGRIEAHDLPESLASRSRRRLTAMESAERDAIVGALRSADGNRVRAAAQLGISRATLYRKISQFGIVL